MYDMTHKIEIGRWRLALVESVRVEKSVETLSDTAEIVLPGQVMNQRVTLSGRIEEGDAVRIELGYDGEAAEVFEGYVDSVEERDGSIRIACMDALWPMKRKSLRNHQYKKIKLKELLEKVCQEVDAGIKVECDYDVTWETFTVMDATGYDVLRKVQEEIRADVYFREGVLHVHPAYSEKGKEVVLDMQRNVEQSSLKYVRGKDRKVEVEVTIYRTDGTQEKVSRGEAGGERVTLVSPTGDRAGAERIAESALTRSRSDGYEGSVTGWLLPSVVPTDTVRIRDAGAEGSEGLYYVVKTVTEYSAGGGRRTVTIGRKL